MHRPKYFFLRLLSVITLIAALWSFVAVAFDIIDLQIDDPTFRTEYSYQFQNLQDSLRVGLSFLIVMFPVYLGTLALLTQAYKKKEVSKKDVTPGWFVYASIFVASIIILISMVVLVNNLLDGDLTLRFLSKLLVLFFVSGSIFGYHLWYAKKTQ